MIFEFEENRVDTFFLVKFVCLIISTNFNLIEGRLALNGTGEPQVDMLDIPGKGRCCVFIARFSYDPPE